MGGVVFIVYSISQKHSKKNEIRLLTKIKINVSSYVAWVAIFMNGGLL